MAELEEYIAYLVTLVAAEKEDPNAAISMIDIENLTWGPMSKGNYKPKDNAIDPPYTIEKATTNEFSAAKTDAGDDAVPADADDMIFNAKDFYKQFVDLYTQNVIKPIP